MRNHPRTVSFKHSTTANIKSCPFVIIPHSLQFRQALLHITDTRPDDKNHAESDRGQQKERPQPLRHTRLPAKSTRQHNQQHREKSIQIRQIDRERTVRPTTKEPRRAAAGSLLPGSQAPTIQHGAEIQTRLVVGPAEEWRARRNHVHDVGGGEQRRDAQDARQRDGFLARGEQEAEEWEDHGERHRREDQCVLCVGCGFAAAEVGDQVFLLCVEICEYCFFFSRKDADAVMPSGGT